MAVKIPTRPDKVPSKSKKRSDAGSDLENHQTALQPRDLMAGPGLDRFNCFSPGPGEMLHQGAQDAAESGGISRDEPFELVEIVSRLKSLDLGGKGRREDRPLAKRGAAQNDDRSGDDRKRPAG